MKIDLTSILKTIPDSKGMNPSVFKELTEWHLDVLAKSKQNEGLYLQFEDFSIELLPSFTGNITLAHLIGPHELIIFAKYLNFKKKSSIAIDLGANIGLHTIFLAKLGYKVFSYEPDPLTFQSLLNNVNLNKVQVTLHNAAVAPINLINNGLVSFTQVLDNPTASGINNLAKSFYGNVFVINVNAISTNDLPQNSDILKMDVEGAEFELLESFLEYNSYSYINIEISNSANRLKIFDLIKKFNLSFFTDLTEQKNPSIDFLPTSWRDGSLHLFSL